MGSHAASPPIRIAISGGGLAGACLAQALLLQHNTTSSPRSDLDVHLFESAPAFREAGAAVGLTRNALAALDLIGPQAAACVSSAGGVPMRGVRMYLAQPDDHNSNPASSSGNVGGLIAEARDDEGPDGRIRLTTIVHRAAFLTELLKNVPAERMHAGKKLVKVDSGNDEDEPLTLHFADGSTHECDILIGADGIHSTVRGIILDGSHESDASATTPRNSGCWAVMALKPYDAARASIGAGPVDVEHAREHMWLGRSAWVMHNVVNDGQLVQFIVSAYEKEAEGSGEWMRMVPRETLRDVVKGWPGHLVKAVEDLLCDELQQPAIYLWDHAPARSYISSCGRIAVMGDAAHATTPWQGSGAGMSIEDSMILSTLLSRATSTTEAKAALRAYDEARRPRTQRIVESSRTTGDIMTGRGEKGLVLSELQKSLLPRWDFILDLDVPKHQAEAVAVMTKKLSG